MGPKGRKHLKSNSLKGWGSGKKGEKRGREGLHIPRSRLRNPNPQDPRGGKNGTSKRRIVKKMERKGRKTQRRNAGDALIGTKPKKRQLRGKEKIESEGGGEERASIQNSNLCENSGRPPKEKRTPPSKDGIDDTRKTKNPGERRKNSRGL